MQPDAEENKTDETGNKKKNIRLSFLFIPHSPTATAWWDINVKDTICSLSKK